VVITGTAIGFVGDTAQLTATAYDRSGNVVTGVDVIWSSSQPTWISVVAGLCTFLSPGSATITATVDGRAYTTTATSAAALDFTLDWAPLARRADLAQPLSLLSDVTLGTSSGYQVTRPWHRGCGTLGVSRVAYPRTTDEWGLVAAGDAVMGDDFSPGPAGLAVTKLTNQGPYDNTTAWQVTNDNAFGMVVMNTIWHSQGSRDNQDISLYKRGIAATIKAASASEIGKVVRAALIDSAAAGGNWGATTIIKQTTVTLTADWQPFYLEFDSYADFSALGHPDLMLGAAVSGTSYLFASYASWAWQADVSDDASNWLRPLPWHETLGLNSFFQTQNSWAPDSDSPVLLGGASRASTLVAAPDSASFYGGRTLSQYTLGVGDGITTDAPYRVEQATDVYPTNSPTGAAWLHWYIEPGAGALPADGDLQGYVTPQSAVVSDTFTRADTTSGLGTADTGQAWDEITGTGGITSDQAYYPSGTALAVIDSAKADAAIQCTWISPQLGTDRPRLIFRLTDGNNYWFIDPVNANTLQLWKVAGGGFTQVGSDATHAWSSGDVVQVSVSGDSISVYINDSLAIGPVTDSFNDIATQHGIGIAVNGASLRFDNFSVTADGSPIGPVDLVRDPAPLRRANGGAFYRGRIKINQASEGYLDFTPKIVNASGGPLVFNAYRAAMTAECPRSYGFHNAWVPKRAVTAPVYNDAAWEEINQLVKDLSVSEGAFVLRHVLPYNLTDLCDLNGNATDADQSNRFNPCLFQSGPFGSADASFNCDLNIVGGNTGMNILVSVSRGSPCPNPNDYMSWDAQITNIPVDPTSFPRFVAFDLCVAWKDGSVVAFGIGHGTGTGIQWLNNGDTFLGGSVSITSQAGLTWDLDVDGDSHMGVAADRDVVRQTGGWTQAMAATKTVNPTTVRGSIEAHIIKNLGPRLNYAA